MNRDEIISFFLKQNILVSPDVLENFSKAENEESLNVLLSKIGSKEKQLLINKDILNTLIKSGQLIDINWSEFEKSKVDIEKGKTNNLYNTFLDILNYNTSEEKKEKINQIIEDVKEPEKTIIIEKTNAKEPSVIVMESYNKAPAKREVGHFVSYFKARYSQIQKILQSRGELQDVISISRLSQKEEQEKITLIGMVNSIFKTKNKNLMLNIEDPTGNIKVMITQSKKELYDLAQNLVEDEVIGLTGSLGTNIVFCNQLFFPDVPLTNELKKANEDTYAAFIADIHVGSKMFLPKEFSNFLKWINCASEDPAKNEVAKKIKYLFIIGDLVDGVGIYPNQEVELTIREIKSQYDACAELISKIRSDIKIIICAGNHDAVGLSEPQSPHSKQFAQQLYSLPNVIMVSNPSLVNIHSSEHFSGFDVLLYHGYSFDYYVNNVDALRLNGGYDRPDLIMKFLLQKRHLAPTHCSTLYIPDTVQDPLVITKVPDFFVTGHIHKVGLANYGSTSMICCSCWQSRTVFQEKVGHHPQPSMVPIVNLNTREMKLLNFGETNASN